MTQSPSGPLSGLKPNEVFDRLVSLGDAWAEADSAAALYEETRKPLLAQIALAHLQASGGSQARADAVALASDEYRQHIIEMVAARKAALRARVRWESGKVWADHARSANANRRAEMTMGNLGA